MQIVSKGLIYTYNSKTDFFKHALSGVDLTVNEGDFFGIIGETGSGKSTFVKHLNGLVKVQKGDLQVGAFDLSPKTKKEEKEYKKNLKNLRYKVGMVFQYPEYQLFAETVWQDVAFGVKNFFPTLTETEIEDKVKRAIDLVGLDYDYVKNKSPFELSGGQKRRVAIAGILATQPEVLVLDEPVAGLDPRGKKMLMNLLHSLHDNGIVKTIIIVSHDMDEVCENVNKLALFCNGKAVKVCAPTEMFSGNNEEEGARLGLPITAYLKKELEKVGVVIEANLKLDDFIEQIIKKYNS